MELSNAGTTIVVTTHYIEEARQANTVSLYIHNMYICVLPPTVTYRALQWLHWTKPHPQIGSNLPLVFTFTHL